MTSVVLPSTIWVGTCTLMNVGEMFQPKSLNSIWASQFPFGHICNMMLKMVFCDWYVLLCQYKSQLFFNHLNLSSSFFIHNRWTPQQVNPTVCSTPSSVKDFTTGEPHSLLNTILCEGPEKYDLVYSELLILLNFVLPSDVTPYSIWLCSCALF